MIQKWIKITDSCREIQKYAFTSLDDSVVATEPFFPDELPTDMVINDDINHLEMIAMIMAQIQKYDQKNE